MANIQTMISGVIPYEESSRQKADIAEKQRDYDIIVIGATGFTGRRAARELINNYSTYRIGLAARNKNAREFGNQNRSAY